jgi:tetrapyrrole methylase family protein/MazG family protein
MDMASELSMIKTIRDPFRRLVAIMTELLSDKGCPWDREQTHRSLKPYLIEEAYEALEAIDRDDYEDLKEELGDVLLQVVFHAELARLEGKFDINEVAELICEKMIGRHPHVFSDKSWNTATEVLRNWEELKKHEKGKNGGSGSMLDGLPAQLPALMKAQRIQDRAARVGFDWTDIADVFRKVEEEYAELRQAFAEKDHERIRHEFGDLLFALVNLSRFLNVSPEDCLQATIRKFISRFRYIEEHAAQSGKNLKDMTLEEMDAIWEKSKEKIE